MLVRIRTDIVWTCYSCGRSASQFYDEAWHDQECTMRRPAMVTFGTAVADVILELLLDPAGPDREPPWNEVPHRELFPVVIGWRRWELSADVSIESLHRKRGSKRGKQATVHELPGLLPEGGHVPRWSRWRLLKGVLGCTSGGVTREAPIEPLDISITFKT